MTTDKNQADEYGQTAQVSQPENQSDDQLPQDPRMSESPSDNTAPPQDIFRASFIERITPPWAGPYIRLARLDRPIGTWLLLFPCWWSLVLALPHAQLTEVQTPVLYAALFAIGAIVMRGAGCTINDIIDRDLDAQVARTRTRPLPAGEITLRQAIRFAMLQCFIGFLVLIQFNLQTITMGVLSLVLVITYPLMKRITFWPQLFLGLTFNWGALIGWVALTGTLSWPTLILYAGGVFWTLGYDTIYAYQDRAETVVDIGLFA
ncbi:MAG: UbiA family prenyltransferase, partial [Pseudomonadota bacterium]